MNYFEFRASYIKNEQANSWGGFAFVYIISTTIHIIEVVERVLQFNIFFENH